MQNVCSKDYYKKKSSEIELESQRQYLSHMSKIDSIATKIEQMKKYVIL